MTAVPTPNPEELRELLAKATPGPWCQEPNTHAGRVWVQLGTRRWADGDLEPLFAVRSKSHAKADAEDFAQREADAALIVALVNNAEILIDSVSARVAAEAERDELREIAASTTTALGYVPPSLVEHDWSDLPNAARAVRSAQGAAEAALAAVRANVRGIALSIRDRPDIADRLRAAALSEGETERAEVETPQWAHDLAGRIDKAATGETKCICDGGAYIEHAKPGWRPFVVNPQCVVHGVLSDGEATPK